MGVDQVPEGGRTKLIPGKRHPEKGYPEKMVPVSAEPDGLLEESPPPIELEPTSGGLPKPKEPTEEELRKYYRQKGNYTADQDAPKDD